MNPKELLKNTSALREERYQYAVGVAADLFLQKRIDGVKMTDIADNCGIGVASLYRHFETKTEIVIRAGVILWERLNKNYEAYIQKDTSKSGFEQLEYTFGFFKEIFEKNKDFISFLDDFDRLILQEKVDPSRLEVYEKSIMNIYELVVKAYERGVNDGTVRKIEDLEILYSALSHTLITICQKFIRGPILPGDDFSNAEKEINKLLEITLAYLAA